VVSPTATKAVQKWAERGLLEWTDRPYSPEDGADAVLVIAATDREEVNEAVYCDAKRRKQWINVVDQPKWCNFTVPSMVKRGKLQIAISTSGASPSLSKKIRQELEKAYGDEYAVFLDLVQEMRSLIREKVEEAGIRHKLMKELVKDHWIEACRMHPLQVKAEMMDWLDKQLEELRKEGNTCAH